MISAQRNGVTNQYQKKQRGTFARWIRFLEGNAFNDPWLDECSQGERILLLSTFAESVRRNEFGTRALTCLRASTVSSAISDIRTTFRSVDPGLEDNGKMALNLKRQLDGYIIEDPPPSHQKALPVRIFRYILQNHSNKVEEAIGQMTICAFFFVMRSCEYSSVKVKGKTELIRLSDIVFYKIKRKLNSRLDNIEQDATSVAITFRNQKNGEKDAMITQHRNSNELCPVKSLAKLTKRILNYKGTNLNSTMNTVMIDDQLVQIKSELVLNRLREVVNLFGVDDLGFHKNEIGTHSIRSSTAMQLFLNKFPTFQVMLIGRWSSDAFLKYIRRQVLEFSAGISESMVQKEFYTVPEVEYADPNDPRTRNTASFATASGNGGRAMGARYPTATVHTWE